MSLESEATNFLSVSAGSQLHLPVSSPVSDDNLWDRKDIHVKESRSFGYTVVSFFDGTLTLLSGCCKDGTEYGVVLGILQEVTEGVRRMPERDVESPT